MIKIFSLFHPNKKKILKVQYIEDFYLFINHNLQANPLQPLRIILSSDF